MIPVFLGCLEFAFQYSFTVKVLEEQLYSDSNRQLSAQSSAPSLQHQSACPVFSSSSTLLYLGEPCLAALVGLEHLTSHLECHHDAIVLGRAFK